MKGEIIERYAFFEESVRDAFLSPLAREAPVVFHGYTFTPPEDIEALRQRVALECFVLECQG